MKKCYPKSHITRCYVDKLGHMTNKNRYIYISTRPVATKLDRMVAYNKESRVFLFACSAEVT